MRSDSEELAHRIAKFLLDEPGAAFPFSKRLAREQGWRPEFARRAIEEYKRFLYLTQVAEHPVCPSEQVDQVWHLHLTFTHSYWDELCGRVLERPLHHVPTRGGRDEHAKHLAMYEQTLDAYRRVFHEEPPTDLWPSPSRRFRRAAFQRVNRWQFLSGLFVVPMLAAMFNPFDLPGPAFLMLFGGLCVCVVGLAWFIRHSLASGEWRRPRDMLDPYELACLAFGPRTAVQTAIVKLLHQGTLQLHAAEGSPTTISDDTMLVRGTDFGDKPHRLESALRDDAAKRGGATFRELKAVGLPITERIEDQLQDDGLLLSLSVSQMVRWWPTLLVWSVAAFGLVKLGVGLQRGKPVVLLFIGICIAISVGALFLLPRRRTSAGERLLNEQRASFRPRLENVKQPNVSPSDLALGVALFGSMALLGGPLSYVEPLWAADRLRGTESSSSSGSGCGTSGGGGSGCGGGGDGGGSGCGGCGGGD